LKLHVFEVHDLRKRGCKMAENLAKTSAANRASP
jgi:hypothetical protein